VPISNTCGCWIGSIGAELLLEDVSGVMVVVGFELGVIDDDDEDSAPRGVTGCCCQYGGCGIGCHDEDADDDRGCFVAVGSDISGLDRLSFSFSLIGNSTTGCSASAIGNSEGRESSSYGCVASGSSYGSVASGSV